MRMRSPSLEQIARLPGCGPAAAAGASRQELDECALRALRDLSAAEAWAALGLDPAGGDVLLFGDDASLALSGDRIEYVPTPTLADLATGVAGAALAAVRRAVTGQPVLAPPEVVAARLRECAACLYYLPAERRCGACRCFTDAKARLAASACPLSHWE
jgi:hypothetical protein